MAFIDRIGVDFGRKVAVEEAVRIATEHGVRYIDCQMDIAPNALESFDEARCAGVRPGSTSTWRRKKSRAIVR